MTDPTDPILDKAEDIIAAFGGIRPMAKKLGVAVTTIQGWKERGSIPIARLDDIRDAAAREGIDLNNLEEAAARHRQAEAAAPGEAPSADAPSGDTASGDAPSGVSARRGAAKAEPVQPKPAAGVRAAASGGREPPVIDQRGGAEGAGAAPRRRRWLPAPNKQRQILILAACMIGAAAVGALVVWIWAVYAPPRGGLADGGALAKRVADLERRLAAAESVAGQANTKAGAAGASARELVRVSRALGALEAKLTALTAQMRNGAGGKEVAAAVARLAALEANLRKLNEEVATVGRKAAASAAASGDPQAIARLVAQTGALQKSVADQGKALGEALARLEASTAVSLKALQGRVAAVEARTRTLAAAAHRRASLLLALGQLRQAARSGGPYRAALNAAAGYAAGDQGVEAALKQLAAHADRGAPTLAQLRERFDPLTARMIRRARVAETGDWLDRMWARVESLVVVRRTGRGVAGGGVAAQIARTETALRDGDLAKAAGIVAKLPPAAAAVAQDWLAAARARLAVDWALADLARQSVRLVGAAPDAPSGAAPARPGD